MAKRGPGRPRKSTTSADSDPRIKLLDAAVAIFARYGYDAVSTGDVAKEAGLSQPMVHYHFGSKELLWRAAMHHMMQDLSRRFPVTSSDLKDLGPVDRLKVLTRRFIGMSAQDPTLSMIIAHESLARTERLSWFVEEYVRSGFENFDKTIADGQAAGEIKDFPLYILTNTIVSASSFTFCFGPLVQETYGKDLKDPAAVREMTDGIVDILFHGLLSPKP